MKKVILMAAVVIAAGFSSKVSAQATAATPVSATIVTPITITKNTNLVFGTIAVKNAVGASTVQVHADGTTETAYSSNVAASTSGTPAARATYTITGNEGNAFVITLPSTPIDVTYVDGSITYTMTVSNFISSLGGTATISGSTALGVGATLNIGEGQVAGTYSGSFPVTVAYN